jgi:hypothetical protein
MKSSQCKYECPVRINQRANSLQVGKPAIEPFRSLVAIATVLLLLIGGICSCSGDKREEQTKKEVKIEKNIKEAEKNQPAQFIDSAGSEEYPNREGEEEKETTIEKDIEELDKNQRAQFIDSAGREEYQNREEEKKKETKIEKSIQESEKNPRAQFNDSIEHHYGKLVSSCENNEWDQGAAELRLFEKYDRLDYKDVRGFKRKMTIRELDQAVKKIPVARFIENLQIYEQLLSLDPGNSRYKKKVAFYRGKLDEKMRGDSRYKKKVASNKGQINEKKPEKEEDNAIRDFSRALKIVNQDWKLGTLWVIAEWRVQVQNLSSSTSFKDIEFKTLYWDESGKQIDESILGHTVHTIIKPKSKIWVEFSELVKSGVKKATVQIVEATRVE